MFLSYLCNFNKMKYKLKSNNVDQVSNKYPDIVTFSNNLKNYLDI